MAPLRRAARDRGWAASAVVTGRALALPQRARAPAAHGRGPPAEPSWPSDRGRAPTSRRGALVGGAAAHASRAPAAQGAAALRRTGSGYSGRALEPGDTAGRGSAGRGRTGTGVTDGADGAGGASP